MLSSLESPASVEATRQPIESQIVPILNKRSTPHPKKNKSKLVLVSMSDLAEDFVLSNSHSSITEPLSTKKVILYIYGCVGLIGIYYVAAFLVYITYKQTCGPTLASRKVLVVSYLPLDADSILTFISLIVFEATVIELERLHGGERLCFLLEASILIPYIMGPVFVLQMSMAVMVEKLKISVESRTRVVIIGFSTFMVFIYVVLTCYILMEAGHETGLTSHICDANPSNEAEASVSTLVACFGWIHITLSFISVALHMIPKSEAAASSVETIRQPLNEHQEAAQTLNDNIETRIAITSNESSSSFNYGAIIGTIGLFMANLGVPVMIFWNDTKDWDATDNSIVLGVFMFINVARLSICHSSFLRPERPAPRPPTMVELAAQRAVVGICDEPVDLVTSPEETMI